MQLNYLLLLVFHKYCIKVYEVQSLINQNLQTYCKYLQMKFFKLKHKHIAFKVFDIKSILFHLDFSRIINKKFTNKIIKNRLTCI